MRRGDRVELEHQVEHGLPAAASSLTRLETSRSAGASRGRIRNVSQSTLAALGTHESPDLTGGYRPFVAARLPRLTAAQQSFNAAVRPVSNENGNRRRRTSPIGMGDQVTAFIQTMAAALPAASRTGSHTGENGGA